MLITVRSPAMITTTRRGKALAAIELAVSVIVRGLKLNHDGSSPPRSGAATAVKRLVSDTPAYSRSGRGSRNEFCLLGTVTETSPLAALLEGRTS